MDNFWTWFAMTVVYTRNFSAVIGLVACLLAISRISHWLGNRGTRRLKHFMWGAAFYHIITVVVTGGQLVEVLPLSGSLFVSITYAVAHGAFTITSVLFCLYVLGIINGDYHEPVVTPDTPQRRETDKAAVTAIATVETTTTTVQP